MESVTFAICFIAAGAIWLIKPIYGLCIWIMVLLLYPQDLVLSIGTVDFTSSRIIIIILIGRLLMLGLHRGCKWNALDTSLVLFWSFRALAYILNDLPPLKILEHEAGNAFDTLLVYAAARMAIRSKDDIVKVILALVAAGFPLAAMGAYQAKTGYNPYGFMKAYGAWISSTQRLIARSGYFRADVTFGQYIGFGMYFAATVPLLAGLWYRKSIKRVFIIIAGCFMMLGALSTVSSGPLFSIFISAFVLCCYPFRRYKPFIIGVIIFSCIFLECYSNRHFYEILTRFAFSSSTAADRVGLINEVINGGMDGHWIIGYGNVGISADSDNTHFNWVYRDFTNKYIGVLARTGLMGLIPFLAIVYFYYKRIYRAATWVRNKADQWLVWGIVAMFIGWDIAGMTVGLVAQTQPLYFLFIGMACKLPDAIADANMEGPAMEKQPALSVWDQRRAGNTKGRVWRLMSPSSSLAGTPRHI